MMCNTAKTKGVGDASFDLITDKFFFKFLLQKLNKLTYYFKLEHTIQIIEYNINTDRSTINAAQTQGSNNWTLIMIESRKINYKITEFNQFPQFIDR